MSCDFIDRTPVNNPYEAYGYKSERLLNRLTAKQGHVLGAERVFFDFLAGRLIRDLPPEEQARLLARWQDVSADSDDEGQ